MNDCVERFERLRAPLARHAYRMLGQYGDAEDVVQDAYLRWSEALSKTSIEDDNAFLRTTVTRLCLDRLRSAHARREVYVGPWLPEPVVSGDADTPEVSALLADDISFALLLALERLAPLERAAFLLHDVLDVPFGEIAHTLGRSEPAVRKLASRAREHVRDARRPSPGNREETLRLRDAFLTALTNDDAVALERLLTDDVVFTSDGGGKVPTAIVPVAGRDRVARLLVGLRRKGATFTHRIELVTLNGLPGFAIFSERALELTLALEIVNGRVAAMYAMRNPDKLRAVAAALAPQS
ncbi:MAG TPA: RNA polymerase sigma factor SigJ [Candidatus Baltobacteraceae bacterium]|jgi:RNA polymerase sigma-70 factor (ECF subfamily)